jgi:hypothetical protein
MASKIILKKSSVLGKIPLSTDLEFGEVALNYADGKLYFKNTSNAVQSISAGALGVDSAATVALVDSAYVQARINKAYINSLDVNAGTLDGQDGIYFLNYNNLINTPTILTTADVENIVSYTPAPPAGVDSDVTEGFVRDLVDSAFVSTLVNNNYIATLVDSAYVALRVGVLLDSAAVVDIVDSAYVSARATGSFGYSKIAVTGALTVEADQPADTLTLAAGANVTITTDIDTDKITISAAPTAQGLDFGTFTQPAGFGLDLGTF